MTFQISTYPHPFLFLGQPTIVRYIISKVVKMSVGPNLSISASDNSCEEEFFIISSCANGINVFSVRVSTFFLCALFTDSSSFVTYALIKYSSPYSIDFVVVNSFKSHSNLHFLFYVSRILIIFSG